ncbi:MAG: glucans biosynthesis glucosyltransferase MdoH [Candidatus Binatia bacterium]
MSSKDVRTASSGADSTERASKDVEYFLNNELTGTALPGVTRFVAMPNIRRTPMAPGVLDRHPLRRGCRRTLAKAAAVLRIKKSASVAAQRSPAGESASTHAAWRSAARRRRLLLTALVLGQTAVACWSLARTFPGPTLSGLELVIVANFAILFSWLSFSFWSTVMGFAKLWRNTEVRSFSDVSRDEPGQSLRTRTAVLMPICNEEVARCFSGIEAIYRSLAATGALDHFDFYMLSDTGDPERQVEEELAWAETCRSLNAFGRIFYRHRRNNIKRKSGNIADFLRRWGRSYDCMLVLDADSIMSGELIVHLARAMDRNPQVGIIQTAPTLVNGESLFARVQQFASRCYGPLFSASLHYWQLGESYYWGHNAILRVAPFMKHCGLARLPGKAPLGGEILSHDFVEAALMGRAGLEVWLAYDLPGSYEEMPPTLLDELKRDRRWCQGNLQHLRLLLGDRIRLGHRAILSMGIMAYASAPLWLCFLILNTIELATHELIPPEYFSLRPSLFPVWPQWHPEWAIALVSTTAILLFMPKVLSVLLILKNRQEHLFGGFLRLAASVILEILVSTAVAPIRMWFHSKFVLITLMGRQINWGAQCRTNVNGSSWLEATRAHGVSTVFAAVWIGSVLWLNPAMSVWLLPVAITLLLSIAISVASSRLSLGRASQRWRMFCIPEETVTVPVLAKLRAALDKRRQRPLPRDVFSQVIVDRIANLTHLAMVRGRAPHTDKAKERNRSLVDVVLKDGPGKMSASDRAALLKDAESMSVLHRELHRSAGQGLVSPPNGTRDFATQVKKETRAPAAESATA